jgi:hypothetical protein
VADPKIPDDDDETIRQAGSTPEDGVQSTHPPDWPGSPPSDTDRMRRSAESGEGEVPEDTPEQADLPSNRAQERGGP